MVMLDSVGMPSGVHVKKPPMIFIGNTPPPRREQKDGRVLTVKVSCLPSPTTAKQTLIPVPGSRPGQGSWGMVFSCPPLPEAPSREGSHSLPHSVETENLSLVLILPRTLQAGGVTVGQRPQHVGLYSSGAKLPPGDGAGGRAWGAGSWTHLDTAVVSSPVCAGGQPLQWACEALTVLPGRTLSVHDLEGLGMVRKS